MASSTSTGPRALKQYLQRNYDEFRGWPQKGLFSAAVVGDEDAGILQKGHGMGMVERVGRVRSPAYCDRSSDISIWMLTETAVELLDDIGDHRQMQLPCGHTGFQNTGEFLQCKTCSGRFTATEVEEHRQ